MYPVAFNHALGHRLCKHSHCLAVGVQHYADVSNIIVLGWSFAKRQSCIVDQYIHLHRDRAGVRVQRRLCQMAEGAARYAASHIAI